MDTNRQAAPKGHHGGRHGGDALGGPPATQRGLRALRAALVAALSTPATTEEVGVKAGLAAELVLLHLVQLVRDGAVIRRGPHWMAAGCAGSASGQAMRLPSRPQPVRDMILACLSEPRQAKDVALHIGRPVPNATGHLAAMCRLGLVARIGYGRYGRADLLADGAIPAAIARPHPVRDAVLGCLDRPMHWSLVAALTQRTHVRPAGDLSRLARDGLVVRLGGGVFAPARGTGEACAGAGGPVCAAVGDGEPSNGEEVPCGP